jgi:SAM-dependent methyltransferase
MAKPPGTHDSYRRRAWFAGVVGLCLVAVSARGDNPFLTDLERFEREFKKASEGGDYSRGLAIAEQMRAALEPAYLGALYNIACMHCLLGHEEDAYEWLERAVDAGYWNAQQMIQDNDLEALRGQERFRALVKRAWATGYIAMLEREERDEFQKPDQVMEALALKPGERVADIGAGSGYFTIPVAKAVGPNGVVLAIDVQQPMIDYLAKRTKREKLDNVRLALVPPDDPQLPDGGVDTILLVDTLHYVKDRAAYASKLRAGLAPGGRIVIIDYKPKPWEERPWGPLPEQQISREAVDADMAAAGFKPVKVHDFLPEQYFVEYAAE